MARPLVRGFLVAALLLSAAFAAWSWLRPYQWRPSAEARCTVVGAQVKRDLNHFWVDVHLKVVPGESHDLMKPVRLVTSAGRELEPADTTLAGDAGTGVTELWLKFWLEAGDMEETLDLRINDGALNIKNARGVPRLGASNIEYFPTCNW